VYYYCVHKDMMESSLSRRWSVCTL